MRSRSPHSPLHNPSFDLNSVFFAMNLFLGKINLPRIRTGKACAQRCVAKEDGRTANVRSFSAFGVEGHESKDNRSEGRDVFGGAAGVSRGGGGRGVGAGGGGIRGAGAGGRGQGGGCRHCTNQNPCNFCQRNARPGQNGKLEGHTSGSGGKSKHKNR